MSWGTCVDVFIVFHLEHNILIQIYAPHHDYMLAYNMYHDTESHHDMTGTDM